MAEKEDFKIGDYDASCTTNYHSPSDATATCKVTVIWYLFIVICARCGEPFRFILSGEFVNELVNCSVHD